ncbi:MAG: HXXEE domain-containing protein [Gammaproteobacteria bacterium]|nr:HXXEE domain-containing protein [Gammaproteobacteria bacterium]MDH4315706.1 HXXEE domain-containing protein [Gammaproteobacteria bacterium]MDH5214436.1 HXXEE domain-containing protein [Gammaproteobacteria bacterium]
MTGILPSMIILGVAALVALALAFVRRSHPDNVRERIDASNALAVAVAIQAAHFGEELATGFHVKFPALFGLPPMSPTFFIIFNLTWIAIWVAAIPGLRLAQPAAYFAAWFLAIAGIINGIGHPILAIVTGGYFPGLVTSPFIGIAGVWLWRRMYATTVAAKIGIEPT